MMSRHYYGFIIIILLFVSLNSTNLYYNKDLGLSVSQSEKVDVFTYSIHKLFKFGTHRWRSTYHLLSGDAER